MHFDDLQVFLAVAQNNSFTAASERLNMPKASVSRAVSRLESHLGNRLFERSTRRLRLTETGQLLQEQTAPLSERLQDMLQHAAAQNDTPQGVLRIAAPYELGVFRLGNVLNQLLLRYPGLEAEVDLTSNQIDPRSQDYDIVFRVLTGPLPDSSQIARRIYSIACGLYAAPSLLQRLGVIRQRISPAGREYSIQPMRYGNCRARTAALKKSARSVACGHTMSACACRESLTGWVLDYWHHIIVSVHSPAERSYNCCPISAYLPPRSMPCCQADD